MEASYVGDQGPEGAVAPYMDGWFIIWGQFKMAQRKPSRVILVLGVIISDVIFADVLWTYANVSWRNNYNMSQCLDHESDKAYPYQGEWLCGQERNCFGTCVSYFISHRLLPPHGQYSHWKLSHRTVCMKNEFMWRPNETVIWYASLQHMLHVSFVLTIFRH